MTSFCNDISIAVTVKVPTDNLLKVVIIPIPCSTRDLFKVSAMTYKKFPAFPSGSVILWGGYEICPSIAIKITNGQSSLVNQPCLRVIVVLDLKITKIGPRQLCRIFVITSSRSLCYFRKLVFTVYDLIIKLEAAHNLISHEQGYG